MKHFGATIKTLRKQKDMTQEQLAEYLGISPQAISRWEIGSTLPDIALIPVLASIFDVTSDILLGIDISVKDRRIDRIAKDAEEQYRNGNQSKAVEILRAGWKEYPNSCKIMSGLMTYIQIHDDDKTKSPEDRDAANREIIALGEKILAVCTDDNCRHFTLERLCRACAKTGEMNKAAALAARAPDSRDLLAQISTGTKRFELLRQNLFEQIGAMRTGLVYNCARLDDGTLPYTTQECIVNNEKFIALLHLMFDDGNFGLYRRQLAETYIFTAGFYARLGNHGKAIENLELAAEHAILCDEEYNNNPEPDKTYTSLPFRGMKFGGFYITAPNCAALNYLTEMAHPDFDAIRQAPAFIALEENVRNSAPPEKA
ncbi:MAG: helix-turn-helix domain-containing protein [Oscillospiraceae bacterium]|nr:helix-turn-helix domain-containing protein [Oscillospiraceae bacterium]